MTRFDRRDAAPDSVRRLLPWYHGNVNSSTIKSPAHGVHGNYVQVDVGGIQAVRVPWQPRWVWVRLRVRVCNYAEPLLGVREEMKTRAA